MYFLGLKHKNAILRWDTPTCTPNLVYIRAGKYSGTKSSNRIKISRFVQVNYYILTDFGPPPLGVGEVGGYGWVWVWVWVWVCMGCPMHAHTHACTHIHMIISCCLHREIPGNPLMS